MSSIMKPDQHEYAVELLLKRVNPSVDKPRRILLGSLQIQDQNNPVPVVPHHLMDAP
jgi:hypothetical protein